MVMQSNYSAFHKNQEIVLKQYMLHPFKDKIVILPKNILDSCHFWTFKDGLRKEGLTLKSSILDF
jgi:hypothetical protein